MATSQTATEVQNSLKDALIESLNAILSPLQDIRTQGEGHLKVLEVTEEFGVHLAELTVDPNGALAIRQLASLILKQYVEAHWCHLSEKFRQPETTPKAKETIRKLLPAGLQETISKVRSSVAYAISAIAHWDWPEEWPELFDNLMSLLTDGNTNSVHGAMRVLTEFSREVTDNQMPHVAPVVLPHMYRIFTEANTYSIRTRGRAVEIFNSCVFLIHSINDYQKGLAKRLLYPVLPQFVEAFASSLSVPDGETSDSGLKMEVIKAITTLTKTFPSQMTKQMNNILPAIWKSLTECANIYVKTTINNTEESDDPVDSDGEVLGFENLVFSIFDFVTALTETNKFRSIVKKSCDDLMYYVVLYMQITEEQVGLWTADPNQFVEDEDEETFSYSVRISAQDLLLSIASEFPKESAPALMKVIHKHIQESEQAKSNNSTHWWKVHESCMLALGSVKSLIIDKISNSDIQSFLTLVLQDLNNVVSPFLCGRALWTASRFSQAMKPELVHQFLQASVTGLQQSQPPSIRISAVRATFGFCEQLKSIESTVILHPFLPAIMDGLVHLATQFGEDILALVLETLSVVLTIDETFTASIENKVGPLAIALLLKYSQDPLLSSLVQDILRELTSNSGCRNQIQMRLLPTLISILNAQTDKVPMGLQSVALDIVCTIVRCNPVPLPEAFLTQAFPAVVMCTLKTDDNAAMQSGGECVRAFISVAFDQLMAWSDDAGNNGLKYVVRVIGRLLDPSNSEYAASFIGRLVAMVISKAGSSAMGDDIDMILRMVLSKMQQAETMSVMQSLIMVYAHLMHSQMEAVLEFLYSVPGPTGKPALEFVLTEWVSRHTVFYGAYDTKVSITALAKLLQYSIKTSDNRLDGIAVKGDQIFSQNEGIRTRSKAAQMPEQWTMIPVATKIYKLLVNELSTAMETTTSKQASAGGEDLEDEGWEEDYDDDDEEDESVDGGHLPEFALAADYLGYDLGGFQDEDEDDPDALADPLYELDIQAYLTQFLQELSQHPYQVEFVPNLNHAEIEVLKCIGITT